MNVNNDVFGLHIQCGLGLWAVENPFDPNIHSEHGLLPSPCSDIAFYATMVID